jgi:hypothetical protein
MNSTSERRGAIATTYLSFNAAIAGAVALIFRDIQPSLWEQELAGLILLSSGIIACGLWRRLIIQYSTLLRWWYKKLRKLEAKIPSSGRLLTQEYLDSHNMKSNKIPIGVTYFEISLSWLFTAVYGTFGLVIAILFVENWFNL